MIGRVHQDMSFHGKRMLTFLSKMQSTITFLLCETEYVVIKGEYLINEYLIIFLLMF